MKTSKYFQKEAEKREPPGIVSFLTNFALKSEYGTEFYRQAVSEPVMCVQQLCTGIDTDRDAR